MESPQLTESEIELIQHSLGVSPGGPNKSGVPYRNYYAADEGHWNWDTIQSLIGKGMMVEGGRNTSLIYFHVTDAGMHAIGKFEPGVSVGK